MINGYVVNSCGRAKHRFKKNIYPGMKVPLKDLYELYAGSYGKPFDIGFVEWLAENKAPAGCGFDIVVESIEETDTTVEKCVESCVVVSGTPAVVEEVEEKLPTPNNLSATQIAALKMKHEPKKIIQEILSVHKLRRALTLCKGRPGKETLYRLIKDRISELSSRLS